MKVKVILLTLMFSVSCICGCNNTTVDKKKSRLDEELSGLEEGLYDNERSVISSKESKNETSSESSNKLITSSEAEISQVTSHEISENSFFDKKHDYVAYDIQKVDNSIGIDDTIVKYYFEKLKIKNPTSAEKKINDYFNQKCENFFKDYSHFIGYVVPGAPDVQNYYCYSEVEVGKNADYTLSIKNTVHWYAGGTVVQEIVTADTFDLKTGNELSIFDCFNSYSELELRDCIIYFTNQQIDPIDTIINEDILDNNSDYEYPYYLDYYGNLFICYPYDDIYNVNHSIVVCISQI